MEYDSKFDRTVPATDNLGVKRSADRPLKVDEKSYDSFTVARMTDHNVSGHEGSTASQRGQDDRLSWIRKKQ